MEKATPQVGLGANKLAEIMARKGQLSGPVNQPQVGLGKDKLAEIAARRNMTPQQRALATNNSAYVQPFKEAGKEISADYGEYTAGKIPAAELALRTGGNIIGAGFGAINKIPVVNTLTGAVGSAAAASFPVAQKIVEAAYPKTTSVLKPIAQGVANTYQNLPSETKSRIGKDVGAALNIASVIPGEKVLSTGIKTATEVAGKAIPKIGSTVEKKLAAYAPSEAEKVQQAATRIVGEVKPEDLNSARELFKKGVGHLDVTNITNSRQLEKAAQDAIASTAEQVDHIISTDKTKYSIDNLRKLSGGAQDHVSKAINDLIDYSAEGKANDPALSAYARNLRNEVASNGLTKKDINELAKVYGNRIVDAYKQSGIAKDNVIEQGLENTRNGLKDIARSGLPDAEKLDKKLSELYAVRGYAAKNASKAENYIATRQPQNAAQKVGGALGDIIGYIPNKVGVTSLVKHGLTLLKGGEATRISPVELEKMLNLDLKTIKKNPIKSSVPYKTRAISSENSLKIKEAQQQLDIIKQNAAAERLRRDDAVKAIKQFAGHLTPEQSTELQQKVITDMTDNPSTNVLKIIRDYSHDIEEQNILKQEPVYDYIKEPTPKSSKSIPRKEAVRIIKQRDMLRQNEAKYKSQEPKYIPIK